MKLAFYAYFYGSTENKAFKIPDLPSEKYHCYYFTNNATMLENLKQTKWIGVFDNKSTNDDLIESNMTGKYVKTCPHKFQELQNYDYLCYMDTKLTYVNVPLIEEYINTYFIEQNYALMLRQHWYIANSVWEEYNESMFQQRYRVESEKYKNYINNQINNGLKPITERHCACGLLIRNMKHEKINKINETWYKHIEDCGIQDQISFFFVKQLFESSIHIFDNPNSFYC
jgi:hypothetical protein